MNYRNTIFLDDPEVNFGRGVFQKGISYNHPFMLKQNQLASIQMDNVHPFVYPEEPMYPAESWPNTYTSVPFFHGYGEQSAESSQKTVAKNLRLECWKEIMMVLASVLMVLVILLAIKKLVYHVE